MRDRPSIQRLRELFEVRPDGALVRLVQAGPRPKGSIAGCKSPDGYTKVSVDNVDLQAHRVVFAITQGRWPALDIDHIDGDRSNNAPANLREVTRRVNLQNQRNASPGNSSGLLGANRVRGKFQARITVDGRSKCVGTFDTAQAAHEAYLRAKRALHEGCTI